MESFFVLLCFLSMCGAPYVPYIAPQVSTNQNNTFNSAQPALNVNQLPAMWSPFRWDAAGSYSGSGTISNQIVYPSPPAPLMNPSGPFYFAIDTNAQVFKMNFTVGGMQKTNASGTFLTFAPGGTCWFIPYWTYAVQLQAYTYATLKHNFGAATGLWTGNIEDVSSCATTVATALLTKQGRVFEWEFQGGFLTNLGPTNFDYQLLLTSYDNQVVPQSNTSYWDVDFSCYPQGGFNPNSSLCADAFPFGCTSFLAGYKPEGSASPSC